MRLLAAVFGILFSIHNPSCSAATNILSPSYVLTGNKTLISSNGKFALGFFQTGSKSSNDTLNSYLGIWFNKVPKLTPVWSANGDNPAADSAAPELAISGDGNLVVLAHDTIIWSTQSNITTNATIAVLLDSGNFILRSSSNSSNIFWQSFDYPTDTLLSGAKLGRNKITGLNRLLVSRKNYIDQAPGVYISDMGLDGIGRSSWKSSVTYWSSGKWNSRFRFFGSIPEISGPTICNFTFVNNDQEVYYMYTLWDDNIIVQDLLDVSGQRISRIWNSHEWVTFSYEPKYQCDVYAVCGPYTICTNNANPVCDCMKGFSVRSPKDWELGDRTSGCIRNTPLNCTNQETGMTDKFYSIQSVRLPQNSVGIPHAASATECAQVCLTDCSCTAYSFGKGGCSIWHDGLINVAAKDNGEVLYLRLAAKEVQTQKSNRRGMIIRVACGASIALLGFIFLIMIWRMRKGKMDEGWRGAGIIAFRYTYLQRATKNFSNRLGGGSFGQVFKGYLSDSVNIAVKRLDGVRQGEKQFKAEVSSIGIIQHINLIKLIGFCCEGDKRLLVYQYMPNRSLDNHIFQNHGTTLGWNIKYQIALGVARGLAYLHHSCRDCIIHCDIKPENILLDDSYVPKISDFGMAKFLGRDFSRVVTTMRGTIGYLAPEWISGTAITSKVDVYSYGMVLLELISGSRNFSTEKSSNDDQANYFPVKVAHKLIDGNIASLVDAKLHDGVNMEEFERVCKVACWCIQDNELDRPTMAEVVQFLEHIFEPGMPPMPRFLHAITGGLHTM